MRHTVRAIIIKNNQVLLVTGHGADFYWTPGGGVEAGETIEDALRREIKEELGVMIVRFEPYCSYEYEDQKVDNFRVEVKGDIKPANEITNIVWYSTNSIIKTSRGFAAMARPRLIEDGLIK